jgi:hypothetical protein
MKKRQTLYEHLPDARLLSALEWHRAVREFFETVQFGGKLEDRFIHADEAETSCGLELFRKWWT